MTNPKQASPKFMDMTPRTHVKPTPTSKPVIITNRPMIAADPMIAESAVRAAEAKKPSPDDDTIAAGDNAVAVHTTEKILTPITLLSDEKQNDNATDLEDADSATESVADSSVKKPVSVRHDEAESSSGATDAVVGLAGSATLSPTEIRSDDASDAKAQDGKPNNQSSGDVETSVQSAEPAIHITEDEPSVESALPTSSTEAAATETSSDVADLALDATDTDGEEPATDDDATDTIEALIAKGTYRLPIGQEKHRRERLVIGLCLAVVLLIAVADVLLDVGIVRLSGVPHTTFFGS